MNIRGRPIGRVYYYMGAFLFDLFLWLLMEDQVLKSIF